MWALAMGWVSMPGRFSWGCLALPICQQTCSCMQGTCLYVCPQSISPRQKHHLWHIDINDNYDPSPPRHVLRPPAPRAHQGEQRGVPHDGGRSRWGLHLIPHPHIVTASKSM